MLKYLQFKTDNLKVFSHENTLIMHISSEFCCYMRNWYTKRKYDHVSNEILLTSYSTLTTQNSEILNKI